MRRPVAGWRVFACEECGAKWEENTRDHLSPSGVDCPGCQNWCHPEDSRADDTLLTDKSGNLCCAWQQNIIDPGTPPFQDSDVN